MNRKTIPRFDALEGRAVPATFGIPWHDPTHLSLSFAPDGSGIAAHQSRLFEALDSQASPSEWQRTILRAFQTWAVHANLNFGVRADGGHDFGAAGMMQGDPRFGDIRIGAHAMTPEVLAISIPPDPALSGTWSGDVLLNSDYTFGGPDGYSLLTVAMHEAGNALGLADRDDPDAVMYRLYNRTRTDLSAADVAQVRSLYGTRAVDAYEGSKGNGTPATASPFLLPANYKGETPLVAFGDVTTTADVDFYRFTYPDDGNDDPHDRGLTVRLQTAGASLLAPKLTVLDAGGRVLARRTSASITGDVLQVTLNGLSARGTYYIRVEAATGDVFGVGRYGLSVRPDHTSSIADEVIDRLLRGPFDGLGPDAVDAFFRASGDVLLNPDAAANETPVTAGPLPAARGYTAGTKFETIASLASSGDVDVYRVTAPSGTARELTASVWTPEIDGFQPKVTVVDAAGRPVPSEVLVNGNGTSTVQVSNTVAGRVYYLQVTVSPQAAEDKGNYLLSAHFGRQQSPLRTFAEGTLDQSDRADSTRLYVAKTQLFHFVLSAGDEDPGASIRMTIQDSLGNTIHSLTARSGEAVSGGSVLLTPGYYTVLMEIDNPNGRPVSYRLKGSSQSDPIGPVPTDSTMDPRYTSVRNPGMYIYPGFSVPYDPRRLTGYVVPGDPTTYPRGFVLPPEYVSYPWLIVSDNPYSWIPLDL